MVREVSSNLDKYYLVLAALSEFQVAKVMAVTGGAGRGVLATHTLTPFQQVDRLVNM
jgi:hypothetical protein